MSGAKRVLPKPANAGCCEEQIHGDLGPSPGDNATMRDVSDAVAAAVARRESLEAEVASLKARLALAPTPECVSALADEAEGVAGPEACAGNCRRSRELLAWLRDLVDRYEAHRATCDPEGTGTAQEKVEDLKREVEDLRGLLRLTEADRDEVERRVQEAREHADDLRAELARQTARAEKAFAVARSLHRCLGHLLPGRACKRRFSSPHQDPELTGRWRVAELGGGVA